MNNNCRSFEAFSDFDVDESFCFQNTFEILKSSQKSLKCSILYRIWNFVKKRGRECIAENDYILENTLRVNRLN